MSKIFTVFSSVCQVQGTVQRLIDAGFNVPWPEGVQEGAVEDPQSVKVKIPRQSSIKLCKFFMDQGVTDVHFSKQSQI